MRETRLRVFADSEERDMNAVSGRSPARRRVPALLGSFLLSLCTFGSASASLNIANSPLFVVPQVLPALLLAVDDSGSMDSEVLVRSNDGAMWWHTGDQSFTGRNMADAVQPGVINFNINGNANNTWKKFVYLFPNGTDVFNGRRRYADSTNDHFAVPPVGIFAWARSPEFNYSYFDPQVEYEPWPDLGGYTFANANPASARTDPTRGTETFNLTAVRERSGPNEVFRFFDGMVVPAGTRYRDWVTENWVTAAADVPITDSGPESSGLGVPISYYPATFYLPESTPLPPDFGYRPEMMPGGPLAVVDGQAPDGSPMVRYEIRPENFTSAAAYDAAIQNFANWFTYYRKRHAASRGAIGVAFKDLSFRVGSYRINSLAPTVPMRNLSIPADRTAFFNEVYFSYLGSGGTPNRQAVNHMRGQFGRTGPDAPIIEACQMNFGVLFTDGYADPWTSAAVGNRDGGWGPPFADSVSNTMADIAAALYAANPRTDLPAGRVPVPPACALPNPHPSLDCNPDLHVNLFAVTMGSPGAIFNVDPAATADPYNNPPTWPTSFPQRNPAHVDDLWHATLNSRGVLLDVNVPSELGARFAELLAAIAARVDTSATSAATSSAVLQTDTLLYTAGFRSGDWSGRLDARNVNPDGSLGSLAWDAEKELATTAPAARNIITLGDGGVATTLQFLNLSPTQRLALDHSPSGTLDSLGAERIAWLRGSESAHPSFRSRSGSGQPRLLGDIVNSNPKFQSGVLYVGANDGMMHAFDAETGKELFAYIPSSLLGPEGSNPFAPLSRLMDPGYAHRYFVDGTPSVIDLSTAGVPKKILVGGLGAGGRTVFALDVTNPASFGPANVMWEFTHPELGYNVGQPAIVQMSNGELAAIFGNGYNSDSHRAQLFVVSLDDGALIQVIDTGVGDAANPNGLAAPVVTDWPFSNLKANRIYAGDLQGNLWRFDVSDTPTKWNDADNVTPMFQATGPGGSLQPITAQPVIALNPVDNSEVIVAFGTGSYFRLQDSDMPGAPTQTLYGIFDTATGVSGVIRDDLLEQTITLQGLEGFGEETVTVRVVSDHVLDPATHKGWYLDLPDDGERVVTEATFPTGPMQRRVRFTTLIPDEDPCGTGRRGFLMDIDLLSGGRTAYSVFDLNRDGSYDLDDMVGGSPVSGVAWGQGEKPTVLTPIESGGDPEEFLYTGEGEFIKGLGEEGIGGRQSWQQLR